MRPPPPRRPGLAGLVPLFLGAVGAGALAPVQAQGLPPGSLGALRFHGSGGGIDRARLPVDDNLNGPDASTGSDVGAGSFTIELWLRGELADNASTWAGAGNFADERWQQGQVVLDRGTQAATGRRFALALTGGRVAFFTGGGDGPQATGPQTTVGLRPVLDGAWHHVALVRDASTGTQTIYVDGSFDVASPAGSSGSDLSYPDRGLPGAGAWDPWLVVGASKYDSAASFAGQVDELRLWQAARSAREVAAGSQRLMLADTPSLAADWRFEEAFGTSLIEASVHGGPPGHLVVGPPGTSAWAAHELDAASVAPVASSLPIGFQREELLALSWPIALEFAPDGRLFLATRTGALLVWDGLNPPQTLANLPVDFVGERGLLGLALDPNFAGNGWLYTYSTTAQAKNRISRFTVSGSALALASQVVLWESPAMVATEHHGGALRFGVDGKLYLATGDQTNPANAQDLGSVHGKLLRLNADGSVPLDNPFLGVAGARPELFALGLRNPFRTTVDAPTGRLWIGDVGGNGQAAFEEIDLAAAGANFGWPVQEGPVCHQPDCSALSPSKLHFRHDEARFTQLSNQSALICGPVYRGTAFPAEYQGDLFFADFANGWLRHADFDAAGNLVQERAFAQAPEEPGVVDLAQGPDGALYLLRFSPPGRLIRIRYSGLANVPPVARSAADVSSGQPPLSVQFSSAGSLDPDAAPQTLSYLWDFGDGATSTAANPQHVYTTRGPRQARLTVSDGAESVSASVLAITIGAPPVVQLTAPAPNLSYAAGDTLAFAATATDLEDTVVPAAGFEWHVWLVHEEHRHPVLGPLGGVQSGSFSVPVSGHGTEHTHYEVEVAVRDSDGLVTRLVRALQPRVVVLALRSQPSGVALDLDGEPVVTPRDYETLEGFQHLLTAPAQLGPAHARWLFDRWLPSGTSAVRAWTAPPGGGQLTAVYRLDDLVTTDLRLSDPARNAEWRATTGQSDCDPANPARLCFGNGGGAVEAGFEFALPLPRGARIESAALELHAATAASAPCRVSVHAYAVADAPPFVASARTLLSQHAPLSRRGVGWLLPTTTGGQLLSSPELKSLVQALVDRPDWGPSQHLGLVLRPELPASSALRCVDNTAGAHPPRLRLQWRPPLPSQALHPGR